MRLVVVLGDGMADRPGDDPDGVTALMRARTPEMDALAAAGELGTVVTVPDGVTPGSDVANLAVLGLDPREHRIARAALEAAGRGVDVGDGEVVFRMNLVTIRDGLVADYSGGNPSSEDAARLVDIVRAAVEPLGVLVTTGVGYRHLAVTADDGRELDQLTCDPPHDILGLPVAEYLPRGPGGAFIREVMRVGSEAIMNRGMAANAIWLWGQGRRASLPTLKERLGVNTAVIGAVDLVRGLGRAMGADVIEVDGATGDTDTNFAGKGEAAVEALTSHELVFVHVEAPDEASHRGDRDEKVAAIEAVDREVVSRVRRAASERGDTRVLVLPDHLTPLAIRTHAPGAVPYVLSGPGVESGPGKTYDEIAAASTGVVVERGWELLARALDR